MVPLLQNLQKRLVETVEGVAKDVFQAEAVNVSKVTLGPTQQPHHGDLATNAAMVLAKQLHVNPQQFAQALAIRLAEFPEVQTAEVAGVGFVNLTLSPEAWTDELRTILANGETYAKAELGKGETVHIEFVSANPTGPMHTGHVRNAIYGDALASLYEKVGYKVYCEYYVNDAGNQVDCLARSVYLRYLEALGQTLPPDAFQGDVYPGDYLVSVGRALVERDGDRWMGKSENEWLAPLKEFAVQAMMTVIRKDLQDLGVVMDYYASEKGLTEAGKIQEALEILKKHGDIYTGTLTPPKGKLPDDWEERPQLLFKSTKYGDEIDRPLQKSDGSWTYFAGDLAYHLDKFQRGFTKLVTVMGMDHCGYVTRLKAAVSAITGGQATLDVELFQLVNFFENGVPVKMSKRAGTFITSEDVVERVGKDATRFMMLSRHHGTILDFDFQKVLEMSQDNPVFYVQYAHARICSVFRHAQTVFADLTEENVLRMTTFAPLKEAAEIAVIRRLALWPQTVLLAAQAKEPHRIVNYLVELAGDFHSLWNLGKEHTQLRFVDPQDHDATASKLALLAGVVTVLRDGLRLIKVEPLEEMR